MQLIVAIIIAIAIFVWQQILYSRMWDEKLDISIGFADSYIDAGESSSLIEVINNDKLLPLPVLHVKFSTERSFVFEDYDNTSVTDYYHRNDAFSVMGNQKITRNLGFQATKRGVFTISGVTVTAKDFFMTRSFAESKACYDMLYVFPKKIDTYQLSTFFNTVLGDIETKRGLLEDPYTFRGIREYDRRDNMSKVNWKASAKSGELMVNMYGYSWEPRVKILLNLDTNLMIKSEYIRELCISLASSLASDFLDNQVSVGLMSNGLDKKMEELGELNGGTTLEHMITIDKYLASIYDNSGVDGFLGIVDGLVDSFDRDSTYIIISSYHKDNLLVKLDYLRSIGVDIHMLVPYLDIQGVQERRDYMYEWEVKLHET